MRFQRLERSAYEVTELKRKAILRSQRRERERYPLFADAIAAEQPSVEHVVAARTQAWEASVRAERKRRAFDWLRARQELASFPPAEAARLRDHWNRHRWYPAVPSYLLSMLLMYRRGDLNMDAPNMLNPTRMKPAALTRAA
jgi:hypothetical protein